MRNHPERRSFTLLEMLIVMAIAMIMMGALVSGYQKVKHGQDISLGATAVQGTLQSARAQAMQLGKAVYVYFIDGGKPIYSGTSNPFNFGLTDTGAAGDTGTTAADSYLRAYTVYDVPYELMVKTADGQELSRTQLPSGIAWLSLGFGAGTGTVTTHAVDDSKFNTIGMRRNCSLIICFAPTGTAWYEAATLREIDVVDYRNSLYYIRIFMLDGLTNTPSHTGTPPFITTDFWNKGVQATGVYSSAGTRIVNLDQKYTGADSTMKAQAVALNKMTWQTVVMNYNTGLCSVVNGLNGE